MLLDPVERRLKELLEAGPAAAVDEVALVLATDEYPSLEVEHYLGRLDRFAEQVAAATPAGEEPRGRLGALRRVLFEDAGFHGDRENYYDPRNSYLNDVLDRRLGIPITLAVVVLGVGRRLGWPVRGVNFPAHFLVRYDHPGEALAVDPFHGGLILGEEELQERWQAVTGSPPSRESVLLTPASTVAILVRMMNNLKLIYAQGGDYIRAARSSARMAFLQPANPTHHRDTGYLLAAGGDSSGAIEHLERYLTDWPTAPDRARVDSHLRRLREELPPKE